MATSADASLSLGTSTCMVADPHVVDFPFQELAQPRTRSVRLINCGQMPMRFRILPLASEQFRVHDYKKKGVLVPGAWQSITVELIPTEWRYYQSSIRVDTDQDDHLLVPLQGYPVMKEIEFPRLIDFGICPIGQRSARQYPLRCHLPIAFEFEIVLSEEQPAIDVQPRRGHIPPQGEVVIQVAFQPDDYVTVSAALQLAVAQFDFQPIITHVTGSCQPGVLASRLIEEEEMATGARENIRNVGVTAVARNVHKRTKAHVAKEAPEQPQPSVRQVFEDRVKDWEHRCKQKEVRVFVCKGERAPTEQELQDIAQGQELALQKSQQSDPLTHLPPLTGITLGNLAILRRYGCDGSVQREAFIPPPMALSGEWESKTLVYRKLQQAGWKVVTRQRMMKRLELIRTAGLSLTTGSGAANV